MRITEITYSKGQTIQLKQFEPVNVHYSIKAEVSEDDDLTDAYGMLRAIVDVQVQERIESLEEKKKEQPKKPFTPYPKPAPDGEVEIENIPTGDQPF